MIYKTYRYVQDLDVIEGEENGIARSAGRELPKGEYFAFPVGEGTNFLANGAIVQVNGDGSARLLKR